MLTFSRVANVAAYGAAFAFGCVMLIWLLVARDTLCLARTGVEPNSALGDDAVFREAVEEASEQAFASLTSQFDEKTGFFIYEHHPRGMVANANNDIRQLIASRIVAEKSMTDESLRPLHEQNLSEIFEKWYQEEDGAGFVYVDGKSKLGANAMLLRVLVSSPFFETYAEEARMLAAGIMSLMNEQGSFMPWFKEPAYEYDGDYLLTFYSGEAILALLEYAERSEDAEVYRAAVRAQNFYIGEYVDRIEANYYPAYVPWHTLSLKKLYERTGNEAYAEAMFIMNDKLLEFQDTDAFIGRFYSKEQEQYGTAHVSADGVYTKGLAAAYDVAKGVDAERAEIYKIALIRAFHNLQSLQYEPSSFWIFDDREAETELRGGFMTHACNRWIRIDNTAHAIDAFDELIKALDT